MKVGFEHVKEANARIQEQDAKDRLAVEEQKRIRATRLADLEIRREAVERAVALYEHLDRGDCPDVRIRTDFIRLPTERAARGSAPYLKTVRGDVATRPPLTKLIHRPGNALVVYLTLLYVAHLEYEPGEYPLNDRDNNGHRGWVELSGLLAPGPSNRELNLRLTRALGKLARQNLVSVGAARTEKRFDRFILNREDGSRKNYQVPSASVSRIGRYGRVRSWPSLAATASSMVG